MDASSSPSGSEPSGTSSSSSDGGDSGGTNVGAIVGGVVGGVAAVALAAALLAFVLGRRRRERRRQQDLLRQDDFKPSSRPFVSEVGWAEARWPRLQPPAVGVGPPPCSKLGLSMPSVAWRPGGALA